jgi:hypothetical protein
MADSTVAALTALATIDGNELFYCVDDPAGTPADRKATLDQIRAVPFNYIAGRWYYPNGIIGHTSASAAGIDSIRLFPFFVHQKVTVSDLAIRISTLQAGQNMQAAIYANNVTTAKPTGNALSSTGNISTAGTGNISAALGANVQLTPGLLYWLATNASHAGIVAAAINPNDNVMSIAHGTSTLNNIMASSGSTMSGLSVAQTFGTWPDLTSASFTELSNAATIPIVVFKVTSVP